MTQEHDRKWCADSVFRGKNVCKGRIECEDGDTVECPCVCHATQERKTDEWEEEFVKQFCEGTGRHYWRNWNMNDRNLLPTPTEVRAFFRTKKAEWERAARREVAHALLDALEEDDNEARQEKASIPFVNGRRQQIGRTVWRLHKILSINSDNEKQP